MQQIHKVPLFGPSHQTHHEIDGKCGGREGGSCMMVNSKREALVLVDIVMRFGSESVKLYH